jgi:hypothetical protein
LTATVLPKVFFKSCASMMPKIGSHFPTRGSAYNHKNPHAVNTECLKKMKISRFFYEGIGFRQGTTLLLERISGKKID